MYILPLYIDYVLADLAGHREAGRHPHLCHFQHSPQQCWACNKSALYPISAGMFTYNVDYLYHDGPSSVYQFGTCMRCTCQGSHIYTIMHASNKWFFICISFHSACWNTGQEQQALSCPMELNASDNKLTLHTLSLFVA